MYPSLVFLHIFLHFGSVPLTLQWSTVWNSTVGIRGLIILEPQPALAPGPSRHFSESRLMSETALGGRGDLPGWGVSGGYSKVSMLIRFVRECDCWCHCRVNVCGGQCCVGWSKTPGSQRCTKRELWQFFCIMHVLGVSLCSALHHLNFTLITCLDKGIPLITLEVKFRMVYLL